MEYIFALILLFILEITYFKIADKYNIIDKPNERSSHATITLRGGGVVFYLSILFFFITSGFQYPCFFVGLSIVAFISFLDDIYTISNKLRLSLQFTAVFLLFYQWNVLNEAWYILLISFILIVGIINAYNFMDGINGITTWYSIVVLSLLGYLNHSIQFLDMSVILYALLGCIVFAFFNFRNKAKAFAGDVGSVSMAFIVLFILGSLIIATHNLIYILFLAVYGVDAVLTIIHRMIKKENIFKAHRTHLYQYLANEAKMNKLFVSFLYGVIQLTVGSITIYVSTMSIPIQVYTSIIVVTVLCIIYIFIKRYILKYLMN